ncbi:hypothetical protein AGMMS49942_16260 [Spirochaetia bacterium]|nr:hypothetical protein AGMMS49942_16260 [Spirochaetia bacterium]
MDDPRSSYLVSEGHLLGGGGGGVNLLLYKELREHINSFIHSPPFGIVVGLHLKPRLFNTIS